MSSVTDPAAPAAWVEPDPRRPLPFWRSVAADVAAHVHPDRRPRSRWRWLGLGLGVALRSSGFRAVLLYRVAHAARGYLGWPGRLLAGVAFWWGRHWYGCSLAASARLYGGLILPHPQGIVIGAEVVVGPRSWVFQNVTLGGVPGKAGQPRVGADARLFAGAVVAGPITVGDNVVIGANVVVTRHVPGRTLLRLPDPQVVSLPQRFHANPPQEMTADESNLEELARRGTR